jgi:ribosomal protein S18 acetylase RimI-like enzyme
MAANNQLEIRPFVIDDYEQAIAFWAEIDGITLNESDSKVAIEQFLTRNPGFSAIAILDRTVVGAVLCGHNGRAGSLMHLAVASDLRGQGLGRQLVEFCFARLAAINIARCNIFVYSDNDLGNQFWQKNNWDDPKTWKVMQKRILHCAESE